MANRGALPRLRGRGEQGDNLIRTQGYLGSVSSRSECRRGHLSRKYDPSSLPAPVSISFNYRARTTQGIIQRHLAAHHGLASEAALQGLQPTKLIGAAPAMHYLKRVFDGNTELQQIIRDEIARLGPISCERFIELALYHPRLGYYSRERLRIGRRGDFITNVSVGKLFGEILADQIIELWEILERPSGFTIIEAGAESGDLASDLLERLSESRPAVSWSYVIVEPSEAKQRQQQQGVTRWDIRSVHSLNELGPITGVILGNELLDAIPARVLEFSGDQWHEVRVALENETFKFSLESINDPQLAAMIEKIPAPLPQPYRTEINSAAERWTRIAAENLRRGFILLIDYGYSRTDYYSPLRTEGTLTAYRNQQRQENIFETIGETDITAHVDFTTIAEAGLKAGCQLLGFTDQHHFMVGAGESKMRSFEADTSAGGKQRERDQFLRAYKTLMHPEMMGLAFKYLLLGKDVPAAVAPSGFRYASDPKKALGL
jgi:SAM-dependent MidA family methyltransferase